MASSKKDKERYALALIRLQDPYKAALEITDNDVDRALTISQNWPKDKVVIAKQAQETTNPTTYEGVIAKASVVGFELLAKSEKIVYIKQMLVMQAEQPASQSKDAIAALKLLAEIEGLISSNSGNVTNTQINNYKVMKYKDHGTDKQWEDSLIKQQEKLINASAVN